MAILRELPYFPLYVDAFVSDEKLNECSASANGVYIRLLCLMHKSEEYGKIRLQNIGKYRTPEEGFADKLSRHFPYTKAEIFGGLTELIEAGVVYVDGECLCQKRMIRQAEISEKRSAVGKVGMERRWAEKGQETHPVEKGKERKDRRFTALEFRKGLVAAGVTEKTALAWMENRKTKKLTNTRLALEETVKELTAHPEYTAEEQLRMAAVNGWGGYRFKWFINEKNGNGTTGTDNANNKHGASGVLQEPEARNYDETF